MAKSRCPSRGSSSFVLQITLVLIAQCTASPVWMPQFLSGGYGRNIRHLPCVSRRTGESGVCMFAYACLKANGTHLGTCIDRFYFGSCCKINDIDDLGSSPSLLGEGDNNEQENDIGPIFPPPFHRPPPFFHQQESIISTSSSNAFTYPSSTTIKFTKEPDSFVSKTTSSAEATTTTMPATTTTQISYLLSTFQSVQDSDNTVNIDHSKPKPSKTSPKPFSEPTHKTDYFEVSSIENFSKESESPPLLFTSTLSSPIFSPSSSTETTVDDKFTKIPLITKPPISPVSGPESKYPYSTITSRPVLSSTQSSTTKKPIDAKLTEKPVRDTTTTTTHEPPVKPLNTTPPATKPPAYPNKPTTSFSSPVPSKPTVSSSSTLPNKKPSSKPTQKPSTASINRPVTTVSPKPTIPSQKPSTAKPTTKPKTTTTTKPKITTTIKPKLTTTTKPKPTLSPTKPKPATSTTKPKPATTVKPVTPKPTGSKPTTSKSTTTSKPLKPKPPPKPTTSKPTTLKPIPSVNITTTFKPTKPSTSSLTSKPTTKPITTTSSTTTNSTLLALEGITTTYKPTEVTRPTVEKPILTAKPTSKPVNTQKPIVIKPTFRPTKPTTTTSKPTTKPVLIPVPITTVIPPLTSVSSTPVDVITTTTVPSLITWTSLGETSSTTPSSDSVSSSSDDDWILVPITTTTHENTTTTTLGPDTTTDQVTTVDAGSTTAPEGALISTVTPLNSSEYREVCGRRFFPESRIVGGEKSSFGKWPWQISLRQWRTSTYLHKCGAALLNENWAITAAHCVESVPPSDLLLRLGEHDLSSEDEPYGYQERRVQIVASHPQFDPRTFEYDLALLRFYEPVIFQPNIIPVCVPEDDTNFVGRTAYVTGWGRLYEDGPLPSVLQEVSVPVINNTLCETMYRSAGYIEHIPHIFICAGWRKGGFDSCEGDSGGPMVIQRPDRRWLLAGIISWGIGCAEPNQPGVYTRISEFREWINQILQF